jgi:hypothetical protein
MPSEVYVKLEIEEDHLKRLSDLLERDKTHIEDKERIALFYILSGKDSLYPPLEVFWGLSKDSFLLALIGIVERVYG